MDISCCQWYFSWVSIKMKHSLEGWNIFGIWIVDGEVGQLCVSTAKAGQILQNPQPSSRMEILKRLLSVTFLNFI